MKRRINNLHKGLFKLNKTSNIIEIRSKKNLPEKDTEKENININQFKYIDKEENNIKKTKNISKYEKHQNKRKSSLNKEKEINISENTFTDMDSSNKKSIINSKIYGNYVKSGKYFAKLRQQVIDKFISGKPLISIDRMYNNPEVKRMFGVVTNTEKTNYRSTNSNNNKNSEEKNELERDRRIPPSKMLPVMLPNNENILPLQFNDNVKNSNIEQNVLLNNFSNNDSNDNLGINLNNINNNDFNNINNINEAGNISDINQLDFNTMNKIKPFYLKLQKKEPTPNPLYIPILYNNPPKQNIFEAKNNFQFINNNDLTPLNEINNNKTHFDLFEFNNQENFNNNEFRRKRRMDDSQNMNNCLLKFNGVNEQINNKQNNFFQNVNQDFREPEEINNLINNLKRANDKNFNVFSNLRNEEPYFNNLMMKNDNVPNFINENLERNNNDIGFGITPKKHF